MDTLPIALTIVGVVLLAVLIFLRRRSRSALGTRSGSEPSSREPEARGLVARLARTSQAMGASLRGVFGLSELDAAFWDGLEEALLAADLGVEATGEVVERVRASAVQDVESARAALHDQLVSELGIRDRTLHLDASPSVVLVVGINGSGKTTSIAKLAHRLVMAGGSVLLGAADTYRAAAGTQIRAWGERLGVDVVGGQDGADPAAVAFDALQAARSRGRDVVIVDTAGRLHSDQNLMSELEKIGRVLQREAGEVNEVLLVLDATAGQNGIAQARRFLGSTPVTGIVLSKLDGTARGGIVVAIEKELGIPVKFIGVGEALDDLLPFDPVMFVDALLAAA